MTPFYHSIKSHPVFYDGYLMRSKLEAKWSIVMGELGITYLYEYQSFETSLGKYLPDFFLPDFDTWVEIKPISPSSVEQQKIIDVAVLTNKICFLLSGFPSSISSQRCHPGLMVAKPDGSYFHANLGSILANLPDKKLAFTQAIKLANEYPLTNRFLNTYELMVMSDLEVVNINQYTHNLERNNNQRQQETSI